MVLSMFSNKGPSHLTTSKVLTEAQSVYSSISKVLAIGPQYGPIPVAWVLTMGQGGFCLL